MPLTISPAPEIGIVIFKGQSLPALVRLPHLAADEDTSQIIWEALYILHQAWGQNFNEHTGGCLQWPLAVSVPPKRCCEFA